MKFISIGIYVIGTIVCYFLWRKYKDKDFLNISFAGIGLILLYVWSYVANSIFEFPSQAREFNYLATQGLRIIAVGAFLIFGARLILKKGK
jgi:hypothetical protein